MEYTKDQLSLRTKPTIGAGIIYDYSAANSRIIEYQPGNGTRYRLIFISTIDFPDDVNRHLGFGNGNGWIISYLNNDRCILLSAQLGMVHHDYVGQLLQCGISDAYVLAELFGHLLGMNYEPAGMEV